MIIRLWESSDWHAAGVGSRLEPARWGLGMVVVHDRAVKSDICTGTSKSKSLCTNTKNKRPQKKDAPYCGHSHLFLATLENKQVEVVDEISPVDVELDQAHVACAAVRG